MAMQQADGCACPSRVTQVTRLRSQLSQLQGVPQEEAMQAALEANMSDSSSELEGERYAPGSSRTDLDNMQLGPDAASTSAVAPAAATAAQEGSRDAPPAPSPAAEVRSLAWMAAPAGQ